MGTSCSPWSGSSPELPSVLFCTQGVTLRCEHKYIQGIIKKRKFKCKQNSITSTNSTVSYQEITVFIKSIGRGRRWGGHRWVPCVSGCECLWGEGWGWDRSLESDPSSLPTPVQRSSAYGAIPEVCVPECFRENCWVFSKRTLTF